MKPTPESSTQEVLAGLVERVTFHNAENGFCVLRAKARGHRDLVTVVGHAAIISAGEWITASGEWINDRAHGSLGGFRASAPACSPASTPAPRPASETLHGTGPSGTNIEAVLQTTLYAGRPILRQRASEAAVARQRDQPAASAQGAGGGIEDTCLFGWRQCGLCHAGDDEHHSRSKPPSSRWPRSASAGRFHHEQGLPGLRLADRRRQGVPPSNQAGRD